MLWCSQASYHLIQWIHEAICSVYTTIYNLCSSNRWMNTIAWEACYHVEMSRAPPLYRKQLCPLLWRKCLRNHKQSALINRFDVLFSSLLCFDPTTLYQNGGFPPSYFFISHSKFAVFMNFIFVLLQDLRDDVIKWKYFPRYWPLTKARDAELWYFFLICALNGLVLLLYNCEAGDLRRHRAHYDVTVMLPDELANTIRIMYPIVKFTGEIQYWKFITVAS